MIINTNTQALTANLGLWKTNNALVTSSARLSSGICISKTGDDPTGMAISNKMKNQIRSLDQADSNVVDAVGLLSTADAAAANINDLVTRIGELAVQAANDTLSDNDRAVVQIEIEEYLAEIDTIIDTVQFNSKSLLNDDYEVFNFQIGAYEGNELNVSIGKMGTEFLGISLAEITATTQEGANELIGQCSEAIERIVEYRAVLGAAQNRLEYTSTSLVLASENTSISLSNIMDTDMAEEMASYTKYNVLIQAGISMLAQANQRPNQVLSLLQ